MTKFNMGSSTDLDDFIDYSIEKISNNHEIGTDTLIQISNEFDSLLKNRQYFSDEETENKLKMLKERMDRIVDVLTYILKEIETYDHISNCMNIKVKPKSD